MMKIQIKVCFFFIYTYRQTEFHDGLVEDKREHHKGIRDIMVLQHLCAKVVGHGGKVYFVDDQEVMEKR